MTREEALGKYPNGWMEEGSYNDYPKEEIVNKIYDDFESRTCENCKHFDNYDCTNEEIDIIITYAETFGCNKFERKEND